MQTGHAVGIKLDPHFSLFTTKMPDICNALYPPESRDNDILTDLVHIILIEIGHFFIGLVQHDPHDRTGVVARNGSQGWFVCIDRQVFNLLKLVVDIKHRQVFIDSPFKLQVYGAQSMLAGGSHFFHAFHRFELVFQPTRDIALHLIGRKSQVLGFDFNFGLIDGRGQLPRKGLET